MVTQGAVEDALSSGVRPSLAFGAVRDMRAKSEVTEYMLECRKHEMLKMGSPVRFEIRETELRCIMVGRSHHVGIWSPYEYQLTSRLPQKSSTLTVTRPGRSRRTASSPTYRRE